MIDLYLLLVMIPTITAPSNTDFSILVSLAARTGVEFTYQQMLILVCGRAIASYLVLEDTHFPGIILVLVGMVCKSMIEVRGESGNKRGIGMRFIVKLEDAW